MDEIQESELITLVRKAQGREELASLEWHFNNMPDTPRTMWLVKLPDGYVECDDDGEPYRYYEGYTGFAVVARTAEEALLLARLDVSYSDRAVALMTVTPVDMNKSAVVLSQWTQMG